jgi:hypothetical protein
VFFSIEQCGLAGNFLDTPESDDPLYDLNIGLCNKCNLVQTASSPSKEELFEHYHYNTSSIPSLVDHFKTFAEEEIENESVVLEIGGNSCPIGKYSNDTISYFNVDPSNVAKEECPDNVLLINTFFTKKVAEFFFTEYGQPHYIISCNNFAHMEDIVQIIEGIKLLMSDDTFLIIEVQSLKALVDKVSFPFFYHEHLFYYSIDSICKLLKGLYLKRIVEIDTHGGSHRLYFSKGGYSIKIPKEIIDLSKFVRKSQERIQSIRDYLEMCRFNNITVAGYGASGQANTLMCAIGPLSKVIHFIVDDSPNRQNKFTPKYHIPIYAEKMYEPHVWIILATNYADQIIKKNNLKNYIIP